MEYLVYGGSFVAFLGLLGLGYCIWMALAAKRAGLSDEAMKARLQKIVALNMGALFLSTVGLMMVIIGVFF